jgi:hypothetical protein
VETYEQIIKDGSVQKCEPRIMTSLKNILAFEYNNAKQGFLAITSKMLGDFSSSNQQYLLK